MKLIDLIKIIPKKEEFIVEEYAASGRMIYGYFVDPDDPIHRNRDQLKIVYDCEVTGIRSQINYERRKSYIAIEILSPIKE